MGRGRAQGGARAIACRGDTVIALGAEGEVVGMRGGVALGRYASRDPRTMLGRIALSRGGMKAFASLPETGRVVTLEPAPGAITPITSVTLEMPTCGVPKRPWSSRASTTVPVAAAPPAGRVPRGPRGGLEFGCFLVEQLAPGRRADDGGPHALPDGGIGPAAPRGGLDARDGRALRPAGIVDHPSDGASMPRRLDGRRAPHRPGHAGRRRRDRGDRHGARDVDGERCAPACVLRRRPGRLAEPSPRAVHLPTSGWGGLLRGCDLEPETGRPGPCTVALPLPGAPGELAVPPDGESVLFVGKARDALGHVD